LKTHRLTFQSLSEHRRSPPRPPRTRSAPPCVAPRRSLRPSADVPGDEAVENGDETGETVGRASGVTDE